MNQLAESLIYKQPIDPRAYLVDRLQGLIKIKSNNFKIEFILKTYQKNFCTKFLTQIPELVTQILNLVYIRSYRCQGEKSGARVSPGQYQYRVHFWVDRRYGQRKVMTPFLFFFFYN